MKKLILLVFFLFGFSNAYTIDERVVDFYFGNGVWNTRDEANTNRGRLENLIRSDIKITQYSNVKLAYNWNETMETDLAETFYQLKEEGQIRDERGFFQVLHDILTDSVPELLLNTFIDILNKGIKEFDNANETANMEEMLKAYKDSINQGHKVILVSHSQGNLFGVRAYDRLKSWQKKYFKQVSVATPANRVVGNKNRYVTVRDDIIINIGLNIFAEILPANSFNLNTLPEASWHHEFVVEYLNGDSTRGKIINMIRDTYTESLVTPSQWRPIGNETCTIDGCDNKTREVKHRYDSSLNTLMADKKVYPFDDDGLLYPIK